MQVALNISEDPKRVDLISYNQINDINFLKGQILSAMMEKLDISDVVTFPGELVQQEIP